MAKKAMKVKQQRKQKFSSREYSRCKICGRPHAYLRKYGICRICFRNANTAKHDTVDVPASKMKISIADILLKEGYIKGYDIIEDGAFKTIRIALKYGADKNERIISGLKRISKPGLRVYADVENMPKVLGGLGVAIISTNKGVVTDKEARSMNVGGEVLAFVW